MEGLFILIGIYVLDIVIKKLVANKKNNNEPKEPRILRERPVDTPPEQPTRSLQDLIKQFEEAQRQAAQGNVEPPVPPLGREELEDYDDDDLENQEEEYLPTVTPANPNQFTFKEIAESVIQWEEVCVDYLEEAFGFSTATAQRVLAELQARHIVGRDMGEGFCDLLVHDKIELDNLFKREQREAEEQRAAEEQESALMARREAEAKHQQELAKLEERARLAREQAGQMNNGTETIGAPCLSTPEHRAHSRSFNKAEIRRGFVWAKVLDEPRFKKRWNPRVR